MHNPLDAIGKQIVLGSLMGDGYLGTNPTNRHYRFETNVKADCLDYITWKWNSLKKLCNHEPQYAEHMRNGTLCKTYRIRTVTHSMFTRLHGWCYREGQRIASGKLLNRLDAIGIAVWWMDDANLCIRDKGHTKSRTVALHIERYSPACCDVIRRWFKEYFGIEGKLCVHYFSFVQERPLLYLRFSVYDAYHMLRPVLAPIIEAIPSMRRKIDFQYEESQTPGCRRVDNPGQSAHDVIRAWLKKYPHLLRKYPHAMPR